ncbi:anhydro-N-acetylmuramic acid kinase [Runella sp.]|uniref:anhydro-N-acetylmuramic acid kinase n=1 Tax=Runella sp. TaxID=1960881 RepID=UPI003D0CF6AB
MNPNLTKLFHIAQKPERRIIGLMSGTSMDGLDVAVCRFSGSGSTTSVTLEHFDTVSFSEDIKDEIRKVFAKKEIDFQHLCLLNAWTGQLHGKLVLDCLKKFQLEPQDIDIVASHGQTVFHAPKILHRLKKYPNATLQIGDGDHIAVTTGIITLSDFRQKHCAAGGEGAPLAVYGDYFIFSKKDENRIMLNMGGIANFTYLPGTLNAEEVFVTDTGPGNTLVDAFARQFFNLPYDKGGEIAASGKVNADLLEFLKKDPFFEAPFPKTTGPELFNLDYVRLAQQRSDTTSLAPEDIMATLTRFSAETIAESILRVCKEEESYRLYLSGGGMHNPVLVGALGELLPNFPMDATDSLGIAGDAKEAVLFAILANETLCGQPTDFGSREGVPSVSMGKISFPS